MTNMTARPMETRTSSSAGASQTRMDHVDDSIDTEKGLEMHAPLKEEPYTAFSPKLKRLIVLIASTAAFWSPFAINIYLPDLPAVADSVGVSESLVNLSVTTYMIAQAVSPALWAPLSDIFGRRPIYFACFTIFLAANLGLAFTETYWMLLVLRLAQAFGCAATIAIGSGNIADISTRAERGGYMGFYSFGQFFGPSIGPAIGGALAQRWTWHSVFFFLTASSGLFLMILALWLPETLRALVGNGSLKPRGIYRSIVSHDTPRGDMLSPLHGGGRSLGLAGPIRVFGQADSACAIFAYSVIYAGYYLSAGSLSRIMKEDHGLTELKLGLCYIPSGVGCTLGTVVGGKLLDADYQRMLASHGAKLQVHRARLHAACYYLPAFVASLAAYGWSVHFRVHLAVPLLFQFLLGMCSTLFFTCIVGLLGRSAYAVSAQ